ncbi:hypothetical protein ACLHWS_08710 [Flavobacterium psychrophilum]|uniref:hypothetical protein n=1 Tax=Flavobacterium psychrophilum TaxID=96345 RepID=UPI000B7C2357|nr:hypothetical protein [Flavobacterium psychrophilum]MCB6089698.1 hypothetical protein [Flavobacterium psychrophilum]MCB6232177.1 hypothetical protein [Flavobacterium psychrophilum]MEB3383084.1 hypothetical protein [Flavobacterium psychrophilum]SNA87951.1 hypothetical protein FI146_680004 [Flavobacterium psychrophilum]
MNFEIGQIVIFNDNLDKRYLVLATITESLNIDYLNSKTGIFNIKDIEKMANANLTVTLGFHYKIGEIIGNENGKSIIGKFENAFEGDIQ